MTDHCGFHSDKSWVGALEELAGTCGRGLRKD